MTTTTMHIIVKHLNGPAGIIATLGSERLARKLVESAEYDFDIVKFNI